MSKTYDSFGHIKKRMKSIIDIDEKLYNYILFQLSERDKRIEGQIKHIEIKDRFCVPIKERKLIVSHIESQSSKITINPCDGRCELKLSTKICSNEVKNHIAYFMSLIIRDSDMPATTMRGKIRLNFKKRSIKTTLYSESKRNKKSYEYNVETKEFKIYV